MSRDIQWADSADSSAGVSIHQVDEELQHYDTYLRDLRGLSPGSRRRSLGVVRRLLRQKFGDGVVDMARLHPDDVRQFLADELAVRPGDVAAAVPEPGTLGLMLAALGAGAVVRRRRSR